MFYQRVSGFTSHLQLLQDLNVLMMGYLCLTLLHSVWLFKGKQSRIQTKITFAWVQSIWIILLLMSAPLTSRGSWVRYLLGQDFSVWSLHVLPVSAWVLSGNSQSKVMQVRSNDDSKLPIGVNVSMNGRLSLWVSPTMNWWLVQGVPRPRPVLAGIGSSSPATRQKNKQSRK